MSLAPHGRPALRPVLEVPVSACCGALPGDVCPCSQDAADLARLAKTAIFLGQQHRPSPAKNGLQ